MTPGRQQQQEYIINYNDVLVIRGFMIRAGYPEEQINAFEGQITAKLGEGHDTHTSAPAPEPDGCSFRVAKMDAMYDNGYAEGAKAAREHCHRMCNERIGNVRVSIMDNRKNMSQDCYESIMNNIDNVTYRIQSLRSQQEAEQQ
jgi:hypothetical protein